MLAFSNAKNIPVEVVGDYELLEDCVWVAPEDQTYRMNSAYTQIIGGRYEIATNICYLKLVERPADEDVQECDISNLL